MREMTVELTRRTIEMSKCADCGRVGPAFEFHPYWVCVLVKNGVNPMVYPELRRLIEREPT